MFIAYNNHRLLSCSCPFIPLLEWKVHKYCIKLYNETTIHYMKIYHQKAIEGPWSSEIGLTREKKTHWGLKRTGRNNKWRLGYKEDLRSGYEFFCKSIHLHISIFMVKYSQPLIISQIPSRTANFHLTVHETSANRLHMKNLPLWPDISSSS